MIVQYTNKTGQNFQLLHIKSINLHAYLPGLCKDRILHLRGSATGCHSNNSFHDQDRTKSGTKTHFVHLKLEANYYSASSLFQVSVSLGDNQLKNENTVRLCDSANVPRYNWDFIDTTFLQFRFILHKFFSSSLKASSPCIALALP